MKRVLLALVAAGSLVSCGIEEQRNNAGNKVEVAQPTVAEVDTAKAALPNMVMVKVPVDAEGNLLLDQAETRTLKTPSNNFASAADASQAFEAGQNVAPATDDLDSDTSTNSWYWGHGYGYNRGYNYWNSPWYAGRALGRGLWWGRNPYVYYGGYPYYYNYYNNYSFGGSYYYSYCW